MSTSEVATAADQGPGPASTPPAQKPGSRLGSLDVFRGFVMLSMLVVNSSTRDSFHWQFQHRGWNEGRMGASFCDMVFPWFLFAVGCAIPFSMLSGRGAQRSAITKILVAFKRALVIYLLGCLISSARSQSVQLLVWDILPIIAWAYFLGVCLFMVPRWVQGVFVLSVLVAKWIMLTKIAYPGAVDAAGAPMVVWEQTRNMQDWIEANVLTIREGPLAFLGGWPGGLTQLLPAAAVVVMGMWAADVLRSRAMEAWLRSMWLLSGGCVTVALAYAWQTDMPFSKDFFTSSYALLAAGTGAMVLGVFYLLVDVMPAWMFGWLRWFFEVPGRNAIALYVAAELTWRIVLFGWSVTWIDGSSQLLGNAIKGWLREPWVLGVLQWPGLGQPRADWAFTILYTAFWWFVCWRLYRKKIFIKV